MSGLDHPSRAASLNAKTIATSAADGQQAAGHVEPGGGATAAGPR